MSQDDPSGMVVGRNSVEPHIERSEAKRSEHFLSSASFHPKMLAWLAPPTSATGLNGVSPHHDALWVNFGPFGISLFYPEITFENQYRR